MSSRALRRLQEQKQDTMRENEVDEEEAPTNVAKKKNKKNIPKSGNLFDLLATEEDGEEEQDASDNDNIQENKAISTSKSMKKKQNKKKKKQSLAQEETTDDGLDEIDRTVNEVNQMLGITTTITSASSAGSSYDAASVFRNKSILSVDPRNLNPDNEMKKKFGASVINNEKRRNPHERRFKRATSLVTPRQNWPLFTKVGIIMSPVKSESSDGSSSVFTFEHQEIYRKVQFLFYDAVESMDHNNIMALLNAHPYHIDSIMQLSEICKMNEDFQMAAELIERALFVFECSFHTVFNVTQGSCRLEYTRAENRPFFLALFRHIKYTGDRACYRTALEFCKVLLGLDPTEDPLCVFLLMDYYAIKADQYDYFVQLADEFEITKNVSLLPNFAYSYALAKFHLGRHEESNKALRKALVSFPSLLVELMDKCGISLDNVIKHHYLFDPVTHIKQSSSLNKLISLYVGRSFSLWKTPEVLNWLAENSKYIIDNMEEYKKEIASAAERREMRYKSSPRNVLRHVVISDIKEAMRALPVEIRNQSIMTHDPLPPHDSIVGYERPQRSNQPHQNSNLFSLFFESLMPSFNQANERNTEHQQFVNELRDQARALEQQEGHGGSNPLAGGAQQLMNAMRELLNTMTYRDDGENTNENQNEVEDAEWDDE